MIENDDLDLNTIQQILEERAEKLAQPLQTTLAAQGTGFIVLQLGQEKYGVPMDQVQEIRPAPHMTRVPNTPSFYAGLVNLRGHLYPVLDLQSYLVLPKAQPTAKTKLVRVSAAGLDLCFLTDDVLGIQWIAESDIQPLLTQTSDSQLNIISGTTPDLLSILNLTALLSDPQLIVQDEVI